MLVNVRPLVSLAFLVVFLLTGSPFFDATTAVIAHSADDSSFSSNHQSELDRQLEGLGRICETPEVSDEEVLDAAFIENAFFESQEGHKCDWICTAIQSVRSFFGLLSPPTSVEVVQIYYNVIQTTTGEGSPPTDEMVKAQHEHLNAAYTDTGFTFELVEIRRAVNDDWWGGAIRSDAEREMKEALRQGTAATLNVYFTSCASKSLGWASFPSNVQKDPSYDGVVVNERAVTGGSLEKYNEGDTLVHETGHWLGLFHTFRAGCFGAGDGIDDTPAEAEPNFDDCPILGPDTCPGDWHRDPIRNYMDYSPDACMFRFTQGQVRRMTSQWNTFRVDR